MEHPAYDKVSAPVLALYAVSEIETPLTKFTKAQRAKLAAALPDARIVQLTTKHYLFLTARDDVLREIRAFLP